jgi:hypothetical protein
VVLLIWYLRSPCLLALLLALYVYFPADVSRSGLSGSQSYCAQPFPADVSRSGLSGSQSYCSQLLKLIQHISDSITPIIASLRRNPKKPFTDFKRIERLHRLSLCSSATTNSQSQILNGLNDYTDYRFAQALPQTAIHRF